MVHFFVMTYMFEFSEEKNLILKETRNISFEQVILAIKNNKIIDDLINKNHSKQRVLVLEIKNYIYAVPYVFDKNKNTIFLKTIYPSRALTKKYLKKGKNE